jgi:hypothetical protein
MFKKIAVFVRISIVRGIWRRNSARDVLWSHDSPLWWTSNGPRSLFPTFLPPSLDFSRSLRSPSTFWL